MTRLALLLVAVISQSPAPPTSAQRVECTGTGIAKGREFVLAQPSADRPWRLSYRDASHPAWIHLPLDGARPVLAGGSARLEFSNANGGRQVQLEVGPDTARLDVYVDYGLDVNIDADLDPDVDLMNTEGPLPVECKIVGSDPGGSDPRDEGVRPRGVRPRGVRPQGRRGQTPGMKGPDPRGSDPRDEGVRPQTRVSKRSTVPRTKVAILGAGFIADIHLESYKRFVPEAEVTAIFSRTADRVERVAAHWSIPRWFTDVDALIAEADCDVVDICLPNFLHHHAVLAAARAGKHIIIEKPLCMTLEEADEMIAVCAQHGRKLMYAEELCFAPKYERVRRLVREGAVGEIYMLKQLEKHSGPHSDWFWDVNQSGGGVLMDMGCHAFAWFRWMLGNAPVRSVWATMDTVVHKERTRGEDNAVCIVEFDNGVIGLAEDAWAKPGGMDDRIEVYGTKGVSFADLFRGSSAHTYSEEGYGYAAEKAGSTQGWTFTMFEEVFNQGYPHELHHFIQCVREDEQPLVTGEDGRAVLEMIYAAYASARSGAKVALPFSPTVKRPIDLWKP